MQESYRTIEAPAITEFREKASKFLGFAFPVKDEAEIVLHLNEIRKIHPKATHHCYAWRLGFDMNLYRANDDGEPSGTAGKPILGQIDSKGVTNTLIIVVRYFGGTLLGTSGLIAAYKESAKITLEECSIIEHKITKEYQLIVDYSIMNDVIEAIKKCKIDLASQVYNDSNAIIKISVDIAKTAVFKHELFARINKISMDEAMLIKELSGLKISEI